MQPVTSASCGAFAWLMLCGFSVLFSAQFAKQVRGRCHRRRRWPLATLEQLRLYRLFTSSDLHQKVLKDFVSLACFRWRCWQ